MSEGLRKKDSGPSNVSVRDRRVGRTHLMRYPQKTRGIWSSLVGGENLQRSRGETITGCPTRGSDDSPETRKDSGAEVENRRRSRKLLIAGVVSTSRTGGGGPGLGESTPAISPKRQKRRQLTPSLTTEMKVRFHIGNSHRGSIPVSSGSRSVKRPTTVTLLLCAPQTGPDRGPRSHSCSVGSRLDVRSIGDLP